LSEDKDKKEKKVIEERPRFVTYYPDSKKTIITRTKIYDDGTIEKTNEDISSKEFRAHGGGVKSDALADYLDNTESKNKNDRKKDDKQDDNSTLINHNV
jgi:hypothetical protein